MKPKTILLILAIAGIVFSCIPSLYPLYRDKDLLLDERLVGTFGDPSEDDDYWDFQQVDAEMARELGRGWQHFQSGYTYKLSVMEEGVVEEFATHLLKLGDDFYLDFFPVNYSIEPDLLEMSLAPSHIFAKAELNDDYLVLHFFDLDWLEDLIEKDRIKISHMELDNRYLLTANTEELQKFILKFANDSTTFIEPDTLPRITIMELAESGFRKPKQGLAESGLLNHQKFLSFD